MVKTFFRTNKYEQTEVIDVIIKSTDPLYLRVCPSFIVDTRIELRLITSDGAEDVGQIILPAFCEQVMIPDRFLKPGVLDIAVVEFNEDDDTPTKVWSGPSLNLYSLDYCFGGHDRIQEIIDKLPEIKQFLTEYPNLKDTVSRMATIVFDPLDVGVGGEV